MRKVILILALVLSLLPAIACGEKVNDDGNISDEPVKKICSYDSTRKKTVCSDD